MYGTKELIFSFSFLGEITPGLPPFKPPPFETVFDGKTFDFIDMIHELGSALIVIPLIAILENVAIAKAFCKFSFPCILKMKP